MFDGDVIEIEGYKRKWVVLSVTNWDINHTDINTDKPGFHAFGGMWYGDNALSKESYGKMVPMFNEIYRTIGKVHDYTLRELKEMVD